MLLSCSVSILYQERPAISHALQLFPSPTTVKPSIFLFLMSYVCGKPKRRKKAERDRLFPAWRSLLISQKGPEVFHSRVKCRAARLPRFPERSLWQADNRGLPLSPMFLFQSTDDFCPIFQSPFALFFPSAFCALYSVLILVLLFFRDVSHLLKSHLKTTCGSGLWLMAPGCLVMALHVIVKQAEIPTQIDAQSDATHAVRKSCAQGSQSNNKNSVPS